MQNEKSGCLFVLFHLLGLLPKQEPAADSEELIAEAELVDLPYRVRDDFLSPAERSFYFALIAAVGDRGVVCPKVRLGDILFTTDKQNFWKHTNRVNQKHVDFVVCSRDLLKPFVVIELDDSSHQRASARERDEFKDAAFAAAGLPLVRLAVKRNYDAAEIADRVLAYLDAAPRAAAVASVAGSSQPTCPKCGVAMVQRTATRGQQVGRPFFGCPNYPKCREVISVV